MVVSKYDNLQKAAGVNILRAAAFQPSPTPPTAAMRTVEQAKTMGVAIVSPVMGKPGEDTVPLTEFVMNDNCESIRRFLTLCS